MPSIDPAAAGAIQPELLPDEKILWAGMPSPRVIFHRQDAFLIPFSLMWGGFATFLEFGVILNFHAGHAARGVPAVFELWGIPFVLIGQYLIWGRFLHDSWKKKRTYYAVTDKRVMVTQHAWGRRLVSSYLDALPAVSREGAFGYRGCGTLRFGFSRLAYGRGAGWATWDALAIRDVPVFLDIEDADEVYRLVSELRAKSAPARPAEPLEQPRFRFGF